MFLLVKKHIISRKNSQITMHTLTFTTLTLLLCVLTMSLAQDIPSAPPTNPPTTTLITSYTLPYFQLPPYPPATIPSVPDNSTPDTVTNARPTYTCTRPGPCIMDGEVVWCTSALSTTTSPSEIATGTGMPVSTLQDPDTVASSSVVDASSPYTSLATSPATSGATDDEQLMNRRDDVVTGAFRMDTAGNTALVAHQSLFASSSSPSASTAAASPLYFTVGLSDITTASPLSTPSVDLHPSNSPPLNSSNPPTSSPSPSLLNVLMSAFNWPSAPSLAPPSANSVVGDAESDGESEKVAWAGMDDAIASQMQE